MRLNAALEFEKLRKEAADWRKVTLHRDGKFYHAYNQSAWLVKQFVCTEALQRQRGDAKMLQASRYPSKNGEYVMLGFPVESLSKYIPAYESARKMEEGDDMEIVTQADFGDASQADLQQQYEAWAAELPVKEKRGKAMTEVSHSDGEAPAIARSGLFGIMQQLLAYPVEQKTPAENIAFISQLRQQAAELL
jgi:hypothetical protein